MSVPFGLIIALVIGAIALLPRWNYSSHLGYSATISFGIAAAMLAVLVVTGRL